MNALSASLVAAVIALSASPAAATPRFAARHAAPCALCHVSPSGGGMRTAYGRVFERHLLSSPSLARLLGEEPTALGIDPRIGTSLSLGSDLRSGYLYGSSPEGPASLDSFFLMQADLYLGAEVGRHATLYIDRGIWGGFEAYALFNYRLREPSVARPGTGGTPLADARWAAYLKLGRFVPAFGIRLEEHSTFTREGFGIGPSYRDSGAEVGVYAGSWLMQASYLKGALTDQDAHGTWYGRMEWLHRGDSFKVMAGASASFNDNAATLNPAVRVPLVLDQGVHQFQAGAHLSMSLGRLTYLGEIDHVRARSKADGARGRALTSYQQLSLVVRQGIELQASHEFLDPDLQLINGVFQRIGASVEVYPWDSTELKMSARRTFGPEGSPLAQLTEVFALVHLFF